MKQRYRLIIAVAVGLSAASTAHGANTLCNRVTDPCAITPDWGVISPDSKPAELKAGVTALTRSLTTTRSPQLDTFIASLKGATFDRQNNLIGGKDAIRSAAEELRKLEPRRPLGLRMQKPAALGYTDSRAFDARVRSLNAFLAEVSPGAGILLVAGSR